MTTQDRMLRLPAVMTMTGLGRDTVYRLAREGLFPRPRKISERSSAWLLSEVSAWMETRPTAKLGAADARGEAAKRIIEGGAR